MGPSGRLRGYWSALSLAVLGLTGVQAGEFVNLDFEHPDLSHAKPYWIPGISVAPTSEALAGWSLTGLPPAQLVNTLIGTDLPPVCLLLVDPDAKFGKYGISLDSPWNGPFSSLPVYHLSQTGLIPVGATELVFDVVSGRADWNPFSILVNGQSIGYRQGTPTSWSECSADVSAYAGREVKLEFVFPRGSTFFDIAGFKIVPEPSTYVLLGLGTVVLCWMGRGAVDAGRRSGTDAKVAANDRPESGPPR